MKEIETIEEAGNLVLDVLMNGIPGQFVEVHEAIHAFVHKTVLADMKMNAQEWLWVQETDEGGPRYELYYANTSMMFAQILAAAQLKLRYWPKKENAL